MVNLKEMMDRLDKEEKLHGPSREMKKCTMIHEHIKKELERTALVVSKEERIDPRLLCAYGGVLIQMLLDNNKITLRRDGQ